MRGLIQELFGDLVVNLPQANAATRAEVSEAVQTTHGFLREQPPQTQLYPSPATTRTIASRRHQEFLPQLCESARLSDTAQ